MEELQVATGFHPGCDKPRNINLTVNDTFRHATNQKSGELSSAAFREFKSKPRLETADHREPRIERRTDGHLMCAVRVREVELICCVLDIQLHAQRF